jgi:hypothetical protein
VSVDDLPNLVADCFRPMEPGRLFPAARSTRMSRPATDPDRRRAVAIFAAALNADAAKVVWDAARDEHREAEP